MLGARAIFGSGKALRVTLGAALALGCADSQPAAEDFPPSEDLYDSRRCASCHREHYEEWSASMHAYAARDPVFLAMNRRGQEETNGALGSFCVNCHAPLAVRTGATVDGLNLDEVPDELKGVTCYFCHNVEAVEGEHNNPLRLSGDVTMRGRIADPVPTSAHRSAHSRLLDGREPDSAAMCGTCHDIVLPSPPAPAEVSLERTYREWLGSVFAPENAPVPSAVATCNSCHLPVVDASRPIAPGGKVRARHSHHMAAIDGPLDPFPATGDDETRERLAAAQARDRERILDPTLRVEICLEVLGEDAAAVHLTLDNAAAGHRFPSGAAQDRRVFVELIAYQGEEVVYQSGVVGDGEDVTALEDPDLWLFRDETFDEDGNPAHMFWEVASFEQRTIDVQLTADPSDERFYRSHAVRRFPRTQDRYLPAVPDRITVRVRVTPVGFDVLDDLIATGHLDPTVRDAMETLDLLPHRELSLPEGSPLERLREVSMEWSADTIASPLFVAREDFTQRPPWNCVGMRRR